MGPSSTKSCKDCCICLSWPVELILLSSAASRVSMMICILSSSLHASLSIASWARLELVPLWCFGGSVLWVPFLRNLNDLLIFSCPKKTFTATTSPVTIGTSSYWVRVFLTFIPFFLTLHFLVYSIFFLETVQTVLSGTDLYYWFAAGFGNYFNLTEPFASFFDLPIMGSVVSLSVHFFFVHRIFVLSEKRSRWICVIICLVWLSPKASERLY